MKQIQLSDMQAAVEGIARITSRLTLVDNMDQLVRLRTIASQCNQLAIEAATEAGALSERMNDGQVLKDAALQKILYAHKFNVASLSPQEIHGIAFDALGLGE